MVIYLGKSRPNGPTFLNPLRRYKSEAPPEAIRVMTGKKTSVPITEVPPSREISSEGNYKTGNPLINSELTYLIYAITALNNLTVDDRLYFKNVPSRNLHHHPYYHYDLQYYSPPRKPRQKEDESEYIKYAAWKTNKCIFTYAQ